MQFPLTAWIANIHRHQLLAEAKKTCCYSRLRDARSRRREHPLARVGKALTFAGLWLRARNEPTICSSPKVCRRGC